MNIGIQLRKAIESSDLSLSEISRRSGVPQPRLTKFMQGGEIRLLNLQRLVDHFGLKLTPTDGRAKKKKPTKGTVG